MRDDAQRIKDEEAILQLLCGYAVEEGRIVTKYLKPGSPAEQYARKLLAREVRANMRGFVGELLALAIDPTTASRSATMKPTRRIKFESPARGKSSEWARDLELVGFINAELHPQRKESTRPKLDAILAAAERRYGLSRSRVHKIWMSHPYGAVWSQNYFSRK